jgi:DNA-directed RNA polymerase subunit RPC12/RpoP
VGLIQRVFLRILPDHVADDMRSESDAYVGTCKNCAKEFSIWDAGGIRYKATSAKKHSSARCPHCRSVQMVKFERRPARSV